ncbi:MAG: nucleotidyltransferase domain-containing protein [Acidobacteriota bacterium]|nr:nucleotidyltransferase domain-containing protein [Acidobacteriota bacterium]
MKEQFNGFIEDLRAAHGDNLASVVLYGSAATGEFTPYKSDYNLLVALKQITPRDLRNAQPALREWKRLGHPLPTYFTVKELSDAADVFPIEFHQMEKARLVLYGSDTLEGLKISDANLRHQTEYELRSKLLQLRRLYIPASVSVEKLHDLMSDSLGSFAVLFRAVLLLQGFDPPVTKPDVVRMTTQKLGIDAAPFSKIFALRERGGGNLNETEAHELFAAYLEQIERVIDFVDKIKNES